MAKYYQVEQNTEEWLRLRAGVPTASEFSKIVTPTGKLSAQSAAYMHKLLAELLLGRPIVLEETAWMIRGSELEDAAVKAYEFLQECVALPGGFVTNDEGTIGASPDRLLGEDGLLEIKCPAPQTHVGYLLTRAVEKEKMPQIQGQLFVTERKWVDIVSYHPEFTLVVVRVERDEEYIATLRKSLEDFVTSLKANLLILEPEEVPNAEVAA